MPTIQQAPALPLQIINNGNYLDDPTAETVYVSFEKTKLNFLEHRKLLQNQGYKKFFLPLNGIVTEGKSELEYIAEAIERGARVSGVYGTPWEVERIGKKPLFYTATPTGGGGGGIGTAAGGSNSFIYRYYRVHKTGQVFGGSGGVYITSEDVSPAGSFAIGKNNAGSSYIDLGDIGGSNVWTAFNLGKPAPNAGNAWHVEGITLVAAIQNGTPKTWSFIGNQRLGIDEGEWGGSDVTNPNYLSATTSDFDLLSGQPVVSPDLFITKASRGYIDITMSGAVIELPMSPEKTTYSIEVSSGTGEIKGFSSSQESSTILTYDGCDIYIKNKGLNPLTLLHDATSDVPFFFKTESDIILQKGDIIHFKYNSLLNVVELVGFLESDGKPIPFGTLRILKIEGNTNPNIIEVGDIVTASMLNGSTFLTFGEYTGGDKMDVSSYDPLTIDKYDI